MDNKKIAKTIISIVLVVMVFASSALTCFAANGPGYSVIRYLKGAIVGINCKVLKDQSNYPYYKYNYSRVRLKEGPDYDKIQYSDKFSNLPSSYQQISNELKKVNDPRYASQAWYKLY